MKATDTRSNTMNRSLYSSGKYGTILTYHFRLEFWRQGELLCFTNKTLKHDIIVQGDTVTPFRAIWNELETTQPNIPHDHILDQLWTMFKANAVPSMGCFEIARLAYPDDPILGATP